MKFIVAFIIVAFAAIACASCPGYEASAKAPPCPKNYLFSCQPNLVPVPCSAPAAGYGSAGAYTEHVPYYAYFGGNMEYMHQ